MHGQQLVIARRFSVLVHVMVYKPCEMLSLPSPWIIFLPAIRDLRLNGLRLAKVTLARAMRPGEYARQEQLHIEWLAHARPPM